jgi:DnaJ-class molecular chaperone
MGKDYYAILELDSAATPYDVANAYRRLAPTWHPSRNTDNISVAFAKFHNLSEAYEVLSDADRRSCFDKFGEFGLKNGVSGSDGVAQGGYLYAGNANEIFEKFFGTDNPYYPDFVD